MLNVGIIGLGFMGRMHLRCWQAMEGVSVTGICDTRGNLDQDGELGNIAGAARDQERLSIPCFQDLETILGTVPLDAVSVTLPTSLHAEVSIRALQAGLHVLCEKPMALTLADCDRMIGAARANDRILQIGHCIRFWPEYAAARRMVRDGEYGALRVATFRRLGSRPGWSHEQWLLNDQRSGGMALDLHIHDTDYILHLLGMPRAVRSFAAPGPHQHLITHYRYDETLVTAEGSWAMAPSFGFLMAFQLVLDRATIVYDSSRVPTLQVYPAEGEAFSPDLPAGDGYQHEIEHFVQRIQGPPPETIITLEDSRSAVHIVQAELDSIVQERDSILS